jgi:hypothetical protein
MAEIRETRVDRFFKKFLDAESVRVLSGLKTLKPPGAAGARALGKLKIFREEAEDAEVSADLGFEDIYDVLEAVLKHGLDYKSSSGKSVLDLWWRYNESPFRPKKISEKFFPKILGKCKAKHNSQK